MRLQSIDFLRGIAIILVMFRHVLYVPYMNSIGWVGVDLFFVLSGFLVSGLLFYEFKKYNTVNAKNFLIRRAFKIYPLFWFVILYTIITHTITGFGFNTSDLMSELFFYQNYDKGLLQVSWSLAVEEHFYLLLITSITLAVRFGNLNNKRAFHKIASCVLVLCLGLRIINAIQYSEYNFVQHYAATHIRIDSLTFGTIIAYNYHFNKAWLTSLVLKYSKGLLLISVLLLLPAFTLESTHIYIYTLGYTTTYIGFGAILLLLLLHPKAEIIIQKSITPAIYNNIATIGTWSYALYLIHIPVLIFFRRLTERMLVMEAREITMGMCYFTVSLIAAYALTEIIEKPFLVLRDKFFPKQAKKIKEKYFMEALPV